MKTNFLKASAYYQQTYRITLDNSILTVFLECYIYAVHGYGMYLYDHFHSVTQG